MQKYKPFHLVLEDGTVFEGKSFGYEKAVAGEVVFNTAMVGYPESLTDPSYAGQLLAITFPLVGNYGVPNDTFQNGLSTFYESEKIQVTALIISDFSFDRITSYNVCYTKLLRTSPKSTPLMCQKRSTG